MRKEILQRANRNEPSGFMRNPRGLMGRAAAHARQLTGWSNIDGPQDKIILAVNNSSSANCCLLFAYFVCFAVSILRVGITAFRSLSKDRMGAYRTLGVKEVRALFLTSLSGKNHRINRETRHICERKSPARASNSSRKQKAERTGFEHLP